MGKSLYMVIERFRAGDPQPVYRRFRENVLGEYSASRAATLALLRGLPAAAWARRGRVNGYGCSVRGLAFRIAAHELHHHRIVRERYGPLLARDDGRSQA